MFLYQFDKLADTLLDRQVHSVRDVDLITDWDRYVPWKSDEPKEAVIGAYWDPDWYSSSSPGRVRFIDTLAVLQYIDVMSYVYTTVQSTHYRDPVVRRSIIEALNYSTRRIKSGRPITNRCFDFGLIALAEAFLRIKNELPPGLAMNCKKAIEESADDLWLLYRDSTEPAGNHNHQHVTGHSLLMAGLALEDTDRKEAGIKILIDNLSYISPEGFGNEHDRKYDMLVAGTLLRCFQLTAQKELLETAVRAAEYASHWVTPGGELLEFISYRPDCCGDATMAYALFSFRYLANRKAAQESTGIFKRVDSRISRYFHAKGREDGLLPGFLYAMDKKFHVAKMDPYYMTGYGILPLMWAEETAEASEYRQLPNIELYSLPERIFHYRKGDFSVSACGWDREKPHRVGEGMRANLPKDAVIIDLNGPGVWGFSCFVDLQGKTYGDIGGFSPLLSISPEAWDIQKTESQWKIRQKILIKDESGKNMTSINFYLVIREDQAIITAQGQHAQAGGWEIGPNIRSSSGNMVYKLPDKSDYLTSLESSVKIPSNVRLQANGRIMDVEINSRYPYISFLTPRFFKTQYDLQNRLVTGDACGIRTRVEGEKLDLTWRFQPSCVYGMQDKA